MVMVALISATIFTGINSYYPPPQATSYPSYPVSPAPPYDYNSPDYLEQQQKYEAQAKKYDEEIKDYDRKSKETGRESQIWAERVSMYIMITAAGLFILGIFFARLAPLVGASFLFSAFILLVFGKGGASLVSLVSLIPFYGLGGNEITQAAREYQKLQFYVGAGVAIIGALLGFMRPLLYEDTPRHEK